MVFSSAAFLFFFLPITLLCYYVCPLRFKNVILVIASLIFYAWGEPTYILIMLFSTVFDYVNGRLIGIFRQKDQNRKAKLVMIISVIGNLGILCFFKYTNLALSTVHSLTGLAVPVLNVALPIGISFYTFQTMSYTLDVYLGQVKPQHNIIAFATYVTCFPQLVAGPIVRYIDLETQLKERRVTSQQVADGCRRFCIGMSKKVLLANSAGAIWDTIKIMEPGSIPVAMAWLGAVCYTFQIYFDFSGYSDMAIGLGKMFGFTFPENFNLPYISKSITEFWRRWHISLSTWFKEYVYIPLGGNRKGTGRQIFNLMVVWALTGFWHGAAYNFLLWGIYYGLLLIFEKFIFKKILEKLPAIIQHIYTMFFVVLGWVLFACEDFGFLFQYLKALFGMQGAGFTNGETTYLIMGHLALLIACVVCSSSLLRRIGEKTKGRYVIAKDIVMLVLFVISICFIIGSSYNPFLYFRF
ncbi:MAG: MBOAT family protein [Lachnospiraceae bacterium]|jgi:alginate O-acetyltransferase complex protein AlgI|nr:MBOAT family protein [Lachnospiraceae bacterium]